MFYRWFRSIQTTCMKAVNVHLLFNHRHKHTGIYIHQFTPQYCFHLVFQLGAPNYIDVSLYAVCFSSQLTDPYGQVPRVYIISYLMLKGFLPKNIEQCVPLSSWLVFHWVKSLHLSPPWFCSCFLGCKSCTQFCEICLSSMPPNF